MGGYYERLTKQEQTMIIAMGYIGRLRCEVAAAFAERQGLTLTFYNPTRDEWTLSDGEIYSTSRIIFENAESIRREV